MKILLVGESSLLHNTLKKGLVELGHQVTLMSDGNDWHNSPRDIDLRRNMERYGRWSGLMVLWKIVCNLHKICGNDIVQVHNYQFVPLMGWWNMLIFWFLKLTNKRIIKGCFADDPHLFRQQAKGIPAYSDTYWNGKLQNIEENKERMAFHFMPQFDKCWHTVSYHSDALIACLYEYYLCYDVSEFHKKLYYIPLPMIIPAIDENRQKGNGEVIKVLVGLQPKREYLKGALKIAHFVEILAKKYPGKIELKYVEGVAYDEYCQMLDEADVLIDFSSAKAADALLDYCVERSLPVVLCTTGLSEEQLAKVEETAKKIPVLKSANMSLGINTLMKLIQDAARVLATAGFDMEIVEKHHRLKLDAPSGTALALADSLNEAMDNQYHYVYDRSQRRQQRDDKEIGISAVRGGTIVGEHEVIFAGTDEVIEFKHTAYSKAIFGKGAIEAAKYLAGKPAGRYDMADVIEG